MIQQYLKFFVNGSVLGIAAWGLQWLIYRALGGDSAYTYGIASALTYIPLVVINFLIQRSWIFRRPGLFWRFVAANLVIMVLVAFLSPFFQLLINSSAGVPWGNWLGFVVAALVGSIPSFILKRYWVFGLDPVWGGAEKSKS